MSLTMPRMMDDMKTLSSPFSLPMAKTFISDDDYDDVEDNFDVEIPYDDDDDDNDVTGDDDDDNNSINSDISDKELFLTQSSPSSITPNVRIQRISLNIVNSSTSSQITSLASNIITGDSSTTFSPFSKNDFHPHHHYYHPDFYTSSLSLNSGQIFQLSNISVASKQPTISSTISENLISQKNVVNPDDSSNIDKNNSVISNMFTSLIPKSLFKRLLRYSSSSSSHRIPSRRYLNQPLQSPSMTSFIKNTDYDDNNDYNDDVFSDVDFDDDILDNNNDNQQNLNDDEIDSDKSSRNYNNISHYVEIENEGTVIHLPEDDTSKFSPSMIMASNGSMIRSDDDGHLIRLMRTVMRPIMITANNERRSQSSSPSSSTAIVRDDNDVLYNDKNYDDIIDVNMNKFILNDDDENLDSFASWQRPQKMLIKSKNSDFSTSDHDHSSFFKSSLLNLHHNKNHHYHHHHNEKQRKHSPISSSSSLPSVIIDRLFRAALNASIIPTAYLNQTTTATTIIPTNLQSTDLPGSFTNDSDNYFLLHKPNGTIYNHLVGNDQSSVINSAVTILPSLSNMIDSSMDTATAMFTTTIDSIAKNLSTSSVASITTTTTANSLPMMIINSDSNDMIEPLINDWVDIVIIVLKVLILGTIIFSAIFGNLLVIIAVFR